MAVELLQTVIQWLLNVWELALVCALQSTLSGLKSTVGLYRGSGPHSGKYTWPWLHDYKVHETQSQNEWAINANQKYKDSYPLTLWTSPIISGHPVPCFWCFKLQLLDFQVIWRKDNKCSSPAARAEVIFTESLRVSVNMLHSRLHIKSNPILCLQVIP